MAEFKLTTMKSKRIEPPKEGGRQAAMDAWDAARNAPPPETQEEYRARRAFLPETENYQPPMSPGEIWSDVGQSVAPTGAAIAEGLVALPGELADARYTLAHYLNRKMSGGEENQNVADFLKTMEQYDPVSMLPNTEDVQGATDPILEALGIKDEVRYEPQSPWGKGLYTAGQNVDPLPAASKGARLVNKVFK